VKDITRSSADVDWKSSMESSGAFPVDTPAEDMFCEWRQLIKHENLIMLTYLHK